METYYAVDHNVSPNDNPKSLHGEPSDICMVLYLVMYGLYRVELMISQPIYRQEEHCRIRTEKLGVSVMLDQYLGLYTLPESTSRSHMLITQVHNAYIYRANPLLNHF